MRQRQGRRTPLAVVRPARWERMAAQQSRVVTDCLARIDAVVPQLRAAACDLGAVAELEAAVDELRCAIVDVTAVLGVLGVAVMELQEVVGA